LSDFTRRLFSIFHFESPQLIAYSFVIADVLPSVSTEFTPAAAATLIFADTPASRLFRRFLHACLFATLYFSTYGFRYRRFAATTSHDACFASADIDARPLIAVSLMSSFALLRRHFQLRHLFSSSLTPVPPAL
jgi:hypothetical protein